MNDPGSTRAVFAAGDYAGVAMYGDRATWQHRAARAIVLGTPETLAAAANDPEPEARLHHGAALWIQGDEDGALGVLRGVDLPHARDLAQIIARPRIQVLAQLPWIRGAATDLVAGAAADPKFEVRNVSYHPEDLRNQPYADVRRFLDADFDPDFYLCAMVEWHHLPVNLRALSCPIIGHIADHDLHIQTLAPWLPQFDELLVTDRSEWLDVQGLTAGAVSSFPKVFGLSADLGALPDRERYLDFFVSGTMLDAFHPDKAKLMHELLSIPEIDLRIVRGFAGAEAYNALLTASKASFTYVRRPGAMPTRGLEALAMGCAVALQEESVLNLFVGADEGVANWGPESGSLSDCVQRILRRWDEFGPAARRGAERVRELFDMRRVASQYLRFVTFRASAPRAARPAVAAAAPAQKRLCVHRTWLPDSPVARRHAMQASFEHLRGELVQRPAATTINDMARELLCEFGWYANRRESEADENLLRDDALSLLEKGQRTFPDHLALRFNLVRAALHHGEPRARGRALQLAYDTVTAAIDWQVDAMDDVMPFDFFSDLFNYRDYVTLATRRTRGEALPTRAFVDLMLASLWGYLARKTGKVEFHERAVGLDPGFARYAFDLAAALLERNGVGDAERAIARLEQLAVGSVMFPEALERLETLRLAGASVTCDARVLRRLHEDTIDTRVRLGELFALERRERRQAAQLPTMVTGRDGSPRLTVLLALAGDARQLSQMLALLPLQSISDRLEVVVGLDANDAAAAAMLAAYGGAAMRLRAVEIAPGASWAARLNACLAAATAPLCTIAMPGDCFRPDAFERLSDELDAHPEAAIACASEGWTEREVASFRFDAVVLIAARPRFTRRRQFETDCVGLHPVWRRSLHERHGGFDAAFGAAAEYEFWLRATGDVEVRQRREVTAISWQRASWRGLREAVADRAAAERARQRHWNTTAGTAPPAGFRPDLPSVLYSPSIRTEAETHLRLGLSSIAAAQQAGMTEDFYGTALMHGDLVTAELMLRTCVNAHPTLLSARLALHRFLSTYGSDEAVEVLREGLDHDLYAQQLRAQLARSGAGAPPPTHSKELEPCLP